METQKISRFLSLILRHAPEKGNISLDKEGWTNVDILISRIREKQDKSFSKKDLEFVVENNDKKRFIFNESKTKIRANQGHSIKIDLKLKEQIPPDLLYHGTVKNFINSIKKEGLKKMNRNHVHLSSDKKTAIKVAERRGFPLILNIDTCEMIKDGFKFYCSDNGVWLTDNVPSKYISISE